MREPLKRSSRRAFTTQFLAGLLSLGVLLSVQAFAQTSSAQPEMMMVKIQGLSVPILISKLPNETGAQAVERYHNSIKSSSFNGLWERSSQELSTSKVEIFNENPEFKSAKEYVLIVANRSTDMRAGSARAENVSRLWREQGFQPVLLALGAEASLSPAQRSQFNDKIANQFDVLMSLGGDDVDPSLYNEKKTFSKFTHPLRDRLEFDLVKKFKDKARGLFVGICRGHQMGAVVDGHTLYQDLVEEKVVDHRNHEKGNHPLVMTEELQRLSGLKRSEVTVNSLHHQAVKINPHGASKPLAYSTEGVIEALEMKNGKGISYQFHPEIMAELESTSLLDRYLGKRFFNALTKKMREVRTSRPLCRRTHIFLR